MQILHTVNVGIVLDTPRLALLASGDPRWTGETASQASSRAGRLDATPTMISAFASPA